jgi:hypothetical protein
MKDFDVTIKIFLGSVLILALVDIMIAMYHLHQ